MTGRGATAKIRAQIRRINHRLIETGADPSNVDRALPGALAVAYFASVTSRVENMHTDPETVISDLLADLMHWCDLQRSTGELQESIGFDSALQRARDYYMEERSGELEHDVGIPE
jgi:hypothetical protein